MCKYVGSSAYLPTIIHITVPASSADHAVCNCYINQGLLDRGWKDALERAGVGAVARREVTER